MSHMGLHWQHWGVPRLPAPFGFMGLLAMWAIAFSAGCRASLNADLNASANTKSSEPDAFAGSGASPASSAAPPKQTSFIGVTHSLTLSPEAAKTPACSCIAAKVGDPATGAFVWKGQVPTVGEDALVLAITSSGVACDREPRGRGASIQGVQRSGADVIVSLEEAGSGRPLAEGAIIPRPLRSGELLLRPAGRGVPYARANADGTVCRLAVQ